MLSTVNLRFAVFGRYFYLDSHVYLWLFDHGFDRSHGKQLYGHSRLEKAGFEVLTACSVNAFSPETRRKEFGLAFSAAAGVSCMIRGGGNYDLAAVL